MKKLSLLLSSTLLFTACSKTVKEVQDSPKATNSPVKAPNLDLEKLHELVSAENPNLALADLLAKSIAPEHREEIKRLVADFDAGEIEKIIASVKKQNTSIRNAVLYHRQDYQNNKKFIANTLNKELEVNLPSVTEQLQFSVFGYVRNKAVDEIMRSYQKRSVELANDVALEIAADIGQNNPTLANQLEGAKGSAEEIRKLISKSEPVAKKIDEYFRSSNLSKDEQYTVMVTGLVAGGIYVQLEKNGNFKNLVKQAKKIYQDAKVLQEKAKEVEVLVRAINDHVKNSKKDFADLSEGIKGSVKDMKTAFQNHSGSPDINSKRMMDFLTKNVMQGKRTAGDIDNISVMSEGVSINKNIQKTVDATANITNNLANILNNTNKIMGILNMKPSKDLLKVMDKANKVAQIASLVQDAMVGYATGGPLGAISAFSGNPALGGLLGGGGSADSAKLDEISRKLDQVLLNQQEIMRLQHETINLIKDMALMIDDYHQKQMMALSEIRNSSLVISEMAKIKLNEGIAQCEAMIATQVRSVDPSVVVNTESIKNIYNFKMNQEYFKKSFSDFSRFKNLVTTHGEDNLKDCYKGLNNAFDGRNVEENPIRAIFASKLNLDLVQFEQDNYQPNLVALQNFATTKNLSSFPLHFPMVDVETLKSKTPYLDYMISDDQSSQNVYELDHLISTKALERYVGSLLILHPLMELDKIVWKESFETIVKTFIEESEFGTRSYRALSNALRMTQSAIGQEAIIAGEPILHKLHERYKDILSAKKCGDVCAFRKNKLLMKNLVMFTLREHNKISDDFLNRYERFYEAQDLAQLSGLFNTDLGLNDFKVVDGSIYLKLEVDKFVNGESVRELIRIPTPEALRAGKILYSENMPRLIFIQDLILTELEKVTPTERQFKDEDLTKIILISNQE